MSKYRELELLKEQERTLQQLHMHFSDQLNRLKVEELALTNLLRLQKEREMQAQTGTTEETGPAEEAIEQETMEVLNLIVSDIPADKEAGEEEEEEDEDEEEEGEDENEDAQELADVVKEEEANDDDMDNVDNDDMDNINNDDLVNINDNLDNINDDDEATDTYNEQLAHYLENLYEQQQEQNQQE